MAGIDNELRERVGRAMQAAGRGDDGWNVRLREALAREGVRMIEPEAWVQAPSAMAGGNDWPEHTLLVRAAK